MVLKQDPDKGGDANNFQLLNKACNICTDQGEHKRFYSTGRAGKSAEEEFVNDTLPNCPLYFDISSPKRQESSVKSRSHIGVHSKKRLLNLEQLISGSDTTDLDDFCDSLVIPICDHVPDFKPLRKVFKFLFKVDWYVACLAFWAGLSIEDAIQVLLAYYLVKFFVKILDWLAVLSYKVAGYRAVVPVSPTRHECPTGPVWPCEMCGTFDFVHNKSCHFCEYCVDYMWESQRVDIRSPHCIQSHVS